MLLKNKKIFCFSQNEIIKLIFSKEKNGVAQLLILANQIIIQIVIYYEKIILFEYCIFKKEIIYDFCNLKSMHLLCFFFILNSISISDLFPASLVYSYILIIVEILRQLILSFVSALSHYFMIIKNKYVNNSAHVWVKKIFPIGDSNPGLLGESEIS